MSKNNKLLSPKMDVVFQHLFGEVGSEKITSRFLEVILGEKIINIDLSKNPILRRKRLDDKLGVLDVIVEFNDNQYCNIEMQCYSEENTIERILFYWSNEYSSQLKKGEDYNLLHRCISILITTKPIKHLEELPYISKWKIIEEKYRKIILTDRLELYIIELAKIVNLQNDDNELLDWLYFIDNPESEKVKEKMKTNKALKEASDKLEELSNDEQMQRIALWRKKAILDKNTALNASFRRGRDSRY